MKKFNQVIKVEVEIDAIAQQLLSVLPEDYKHREILAEAIIGNCVNQGGISYVYNALSGFGNDINFNVGDVVFCTDKVSNSVRYHHDSPNNWHKFELGTVLIKEIDLYKADKLKVEYAYIKVEDNQWSIEKGEDWVDHRQCKFLDGRFDTYLDELQVICDNNNSIKPEQEVIA